MIQFEDPDFGNELCNLTGIKELPQDSAVLRILWKSSGVPDDMASTSSITSVSTPESASMSPTPSTSSAQCSSVQLMQQEISVHWPSPFPVPVFSYDVELSLAKGNECFKDSGALLNVARKMKMDISDSIAKVFFFPQGLPTGIKQAMTGGP